MNADDFGRSEGINRGVIRAHEEGIVTSATLMVRWPAAEQAAAYTRSSSLAVGLHLDLGEWVYRHGEWQTAYEVPGSDSRELVSAEIGRQLAEFERLVGRQPTHLDSHQHVHRDEPVRSALLEAGARLGVPVRHFCGGIEYSGAFYGQDGKGNPFPEAITPEALVETIESLGVGVTELACHPAAEPELESSYAAERVRELESLCDPRVRETIDHAGIVLRSFAELDAEGALRAP